MSLTGGEITEGHAAPLAVQIDAAEVVAGLIIQTCGVDNSAGGHHPDNIPLYQPLGGGGVLHLLADGHLVALGDETGNIGLAGVIGDAAHGDPFFLRLGVFAVVPGGQGQVQLLGGQLGIVGEHLIEVPQTEKQNGIRIVLLDFQILLHHGGQFRHKNTSFCFDIDIICLLGSNCAPGLCAYVRRTAAGMQALPCGMHPPFSF